MQLPVACVRELVTDHLALSAIVAPHWLRMQLPITHVLHVPSVKQLRVIIPEYPWLHVPEGVPGCELAQSALA